MASNRIELGVAGALAALVAAASLAVQQPASVEVHDAGQYYLMARQLAAGETPAAEAPYVYRLGVPWLAAQGWPANPVRGFLVINLAAAVLTAPLLVLWLRTGIRSAAVRLGMVVLFAAAWHGPLRYVPYNPGYVDPVFLVAALAGLLLIEALVERPSVATLVGLGVLSTAGALVRETMLLVPLAGVWAGRSVATWWWPRRWGTLAAVAGAAAAIAFTHGVVVADTSRSFTAAFAQWVQKPPTAYLLAWFAAYGPVLAILVFDWRATAADLRARPHLLAFLGGCTVLAFFGGSDTERFLFWAMPVVYLLIGRAVERRLPVLRAPVLAAALVMVQAVSARVFWTIPDTRLDPAPLAADAGLLDRVYAVLDRLLIIEHFHWNLWSSFGSQPFRLARLALYLVVTAALVWMMTRRHRTLTAGREAAA